MFLLEQKKIIGALGNMIDSIDFEKNWVDWMEIEMMEMMVIWVDCMKCEVIDNQYDEIYYLITECMPLSEINSWRNDNKGQKSILIIGYARGWSLASEYLLSHPIEPDPDALMNETSIILSTPIIETGKTIKTLYKAIDMRVQNTQIYNPLAYELGLDMSIKLIKQFKN